jgi:hypothetical protein
MNVFIYLCGFVCCSTIQLRIPNRLYTSMLDVGKLPAVSVSILHSIVNSHKQKRRATDLILNIVGPGYQPGCIILRVGNLAD